MANGSQGGVAGRISRQNSRGDRGGAQGEDGSEGIILLIDIERKLDSWPSLSTAGSYLDRAIRRFSGLPR